MRRWLPELSRLPSEWIHHPWDAPPNVLRAAGIELGSNYPRPIVEVASARERLERALADMMDREAALRAEGLEEGLGDNVGLEGPEVPENMDVDRGANYAVERNTLVRSPHDQMVPSMHMDVGRAVVGAAASHAFERGIEERRVLVGVNGHTGQVHGGRPAPLAMDGGADDTESTAESSSAQRDHQHSTGNGLSAWSRYRPSHPAMHQDDSQVPLVPELRHGVLSR